MRVNTRYINSIRGTSSNCSTEIRLSVKIAWDTGPMYLQYGHATPFSLINTITLRMMEVNESICEVRGGRFKLNCGPRCRDRELNSPPPPTPPTPISPSPASDLTAFFFLFSCFNSCVTEKVELFLPLFLSLSLFFFFFLFSFFFLSNIKFRFTVVTHRCFLFERYLE